MQYKVLYFVFNRFYYNDLLSFNLTFAIGLYIA